jgi:hypothetical protein
MRATLTRSSLERIKGYNPWLCMDIRAHNKKVFAN